MDIKSFNVESNIALMQELLSCGTTVHLWQYATDGHLISTTSPDLVLDTIFEFSGCKECMLTHLQSSRMPMILSANLGLMWCAVFSPVTAESQRVYVMGPLFNTEISMKAIERSVQAQDVPLNWRQTYVNLLASVPVMSSMLSFQYVLMLHYCVTGEKINRGEILQSRVTSQNRQSDPEEPEEKGDRMRTWIAERSMLSMVREGDLNYQKAMDNSALLSSGVKSGGDTPMLHALISCTCFTSLCVREAIQAGLSPETAYTVGDEYIQNMVAAKDMAELTAINHDMYVDFISRVHKHRTNPKVSNYIQVCRDYIEMHAEDELSLPILAKRIGYSEYHLSRKFKQEMGVSISTYIRYSRVERAKFLLENTRLSISQIAANLHFCSSSHFSNAFLEVTGKKPQEYRREHPGLSTP